MIHIKTEKEIAIMATAGRMLAETLFTVCKSVKPGITELELDQMAERLIKEKGGEEAFKYVPGWHHTICTATNEIIVHGVPTKRVLNKGDIIGIDCGVYLDGFNTDMAETVFVGDNLSMPNEIGMFLKAGKDALYAGMEQVKAGHHVGHVSQAIQHIIESHGYSVVRELIGHGVGRKLHEEPEVPGYLIGKIERTPLLKEGMTIAVEVIYTMGKRQIAYANTDGWTIQTKDGSLAGLFERTVLVTNSGYVILTE